MSSKPIDLSREERAAAQGAIQRYFRDEHSLELGNLGADLVIDFFAEKLGPVFYNQGLYDAEAAIRMRAEELGESILSLERPVPSPPSK